MMQQQLKYTNKRRGCKTAGKAKLRSCLPFGASMNEKSTNTKKNRQFSHNLLPVFCKYSMSELSENGNELAQSVTFHTLNEEISFD